MTAGCSVLNRISNYREMGRGKRLVLGANDACCAVEKSASLIELWSRATLWSPTNDLLSLNILV